MMYLARIRELDRSRRCLGINRELRSQLCQRHHSVC